MPYKYIKAIYSYIQLNRKRWKIILRAKLVILVLCLTTLLRGYALVMQEEKQLSVVVLFDKEINLILGSLMIILAIGKFIFLFSKNPKWKKYLLMGILLCWTTLLWGYLSSPITNTGSINALSMVLLSYIGLYYGEGANADADFKPND